MGFQKVKIQKLMCPDEAEPFPDPVGPAEAVQAHLDLRAGLSIAAHFQVFQLGADGFDDALNELKSVLAERDLKPDTFIAPLPGQSVELTARFDNMDGLVSLQKTGVNR